MTATSKVKADLDADEDYLSSESEFVCPQLIVGIGLIEPSFIQLELNVDNFRLRTYANPLLIVDYRYHTNDEQSNEWMCAKLQMRRLDESFYLKIDRSYYDYQISTILSIINPITKDFIYLPSQQLTIDIPNETAAIEWKPEMECEFYNPKSRTFQQCRITQKMDNNLNQYRINNYYSRQSIIVSANVLRSNSKLWYNFVDCSHFLNVDKCLIIDGYVNPIECEAIHLSLVSVISQSIEVAASDLYSSRKAIPIQMNNGADHINIGASRSISIGICEYLFTPQNRWRIQCPSCDSADVQSCFKFAYGYHGTGKSTCIVCSNCMKEIVNEYVYLCPVQTIAHKICCDCCYSMVMKRKYFSNTLLPLLENTLNSDCIAEIVTFLAGNVVLI